LRHEQPHGLHEQFVFIHEGRDLIAAFSWVAGLFYLPDFSPITLRSASGRSSRNIQGNGTSAFQESSNGCDNRFGGWSMKRLRLALVGIVAFVIVQPF
jgi:hypothetical protein